MLDPARQIEDHSSTVSLVVVLADHAAAPATVSKSAIGAARLCLIEALGRAFEALRDPECASLVGPLVPGALMPGGARVPGTSLELDPAQAAFCNGLLLCRSVSGDHGQDSGTGSAAHSIAAILAVADYQARKAAMEGKSPPTVRDVLTAIVKGLRTHEMLAVEDSSQQASAAALSLMRVITTAVVAAQLGGTKEQIATALSYACVDGGSSIAASAQHEIGRRDWATADAISRAVRHACQAMAAGESSYLTSVQLEAMDVAGRFLVTNPSAGRGQVGDGTIDRLIGSYGAHEVAQLTTRFQEAVGRHFPPRQAERIKALFAAPERLDDLPINELLAALVTNGSR